jgi:hypothetical protein
MTGGPRRDPPAAGTADGTKSAGAATRHSQGLIAVMLVAAAVLDLTRCGLVLSAPRHPALAAGLVAAGFCAAAMSLWAARGCQRGRRWPGWAALLVGAASAPQAAALGYRAPYTIPDTATAVLGVLLTVTVLAAIGPDEPPWRDAGSRCAVGPRKRPVKAASQVRAGSAMNDRPVAFVLRGKGALAQSLLVVAAAVEDDMGSTGRGHRPWWWPRRRKNFPAARRSSHVCTGDGLTMADAMQAAIGLLAAGLDSPGLQAWAVSALIPEDEAAVGDVFAGLHVVAHLLLRELQAGTGEPQQDALQRLALLAEARRDTPMAG